MNLVSSLIADVPDWPKPGVVFKDITPLLASPEGFRQAVDAIVASAPEAIDVVVGMEARGFIFAAPVALALGAGFVLSGPVSCRSGNRGSCRVPC